MKSASGESPSDGIVRRREKGRTSAVDPEEDRFLLVAVLGLGPDIDEQTVFIQRIAFLSITRQELLARGTSDEGMIHRAPVGGTVPVYLAFDDRPGDGPLTGSRFGSDGFDSR